MSIDVTIPEVGESITTATLGQWQVKQGDRVKKDQTLVELETDKVNLELPSPASGVIAEILKKKGETGNVGEVIARIEESRGDDAPDGKEDSVETEEREADESAEASSEDGNAKEESDEAEGSAKREERKETVAKQAVKEQSDAGDGGAEDNEGEEPAAQEGQKEVKEKGKEKVKEKTTAANPPAAVASADGREEDLVPMTPIRKRIAERLLAAQHNAALLTTFNEINMSRVLQLRDLHRETFEKRYGVKLGFMSFFIKATIEALGRFPALNAEIRGDHIAFRNYFDIGIAVSTERGLVVPVIRDAQNLSFAEVEKAVNDLAGKARDNRITLDDLKGGTFTITNGGVFGSLLSTPIVNPPQSGVLGMHTIQKRPVVVEDRIVIRPMMYVALTYDHRIVDGRQAVQFLIRVKETLEDPARMVLEV